MVGLSKNHAVAASRSGSTRPVPGCYTTLMGTTTEAMEAYREARDEYYSSPEGIEKNKQRSEDPNLTPEQREEAKRFAEEGEATRERQKEDYAFQKALDKQQKQTAPVRSGGSGSTLGRQMMRGHTRGHRKSSKEAPAKPMNNTSGETPDEVILGLFGEMLAGVLGVKS